MAEMDGSVLLPNATGVDQADHEVASICHKLHTAPVVDTTNACWRPSPWRTTDTRCAATSRDSFAHGPQVATADALDARIVYSA